MDFVDRFSGRGSATRRFTPDTLFKFTDLSPVVQQHLQKVYLTLAGALLCSALGCYFNMLTGMGGLLAILGFIVCTTWLMMTQPVPSQLNKRYALLGGAAFSQGLTLGPLIDMVVNISPGIILTAFLATAAVFGCFSVASMLSKRRSYLYLGGMLTSVLTTFALMRFATWMFGGALLLYQAELYLGLLVFMGYVLFDTQVIIEEAYADGRSADHIKGALTLFVDFVAIFVRLLVILAKKAERSDDDDSSRSRRRKGAYRR
eukprot:jgi/Botrbrau1/1465/Bobra.178_3s0022.1